MVASVASYAKRISDNGSIGKLLNLNHEIILNLIDEDLVQVDRFFDRFHSKGLTPYHQHAYSQTG